MVKTRSASRAALLPSSSADPDGPPPDVDGEQVLQHLGRLGRKDPTTKLKALSALSTLFPQKPGKEVGQIVPQWAFEYKRLLLDYNRDVRRATNDTMSSLVTAVKKDLAPHLKSLMGPWWFSQFDPAAEVAQAARRSFEAAFPQSDRRLDALMLSVKEIFLYLNENLKLTTQALSDKVTPVDELEDMYERVLSSSLLAMATLIDILLGVKLQSGGSDSSNTESKSHSEVRSATLSSAEAALSMHKYFIDFLKSKSAAIRSATYTLLKSYVKYVPHVFNEEAMKILSSTLLGAFNEKDPLCHSAMWDTVLTFSRRFPEAWSYCNVRKVVLNRFWQFLQIGCYGSKQASYPLIVQFLDSIPPKEVAAEQFAFELLKNLWAGRNQRQLSAADSLAFFTAFKQSFLWLLKNVPRNSVEDSSYYIRKELITSVLVKMVWQDYLQLSLSKNLDVVPSLLSEEATTDDNQLSHKKSLLAANVRHPVYYYQDLGKCIAEILDDISVTESHLLGTACESLLRDYLDIVQQGEKLSKFPDHIDLLVSFFRSLDVLVVQNGRTWPLENLARPLIEHSLPAIKSMDSPSLVKLLLVLVDIFGPAPLFLKNSGINDDKSYVEPYLSLFNADFVPWCLDGKYSTCSSKIDLLLSLIQEECFFDQWCLIIKHTGAKQKGSVDQFEVLTLILKKVRERIASGKLKNLQRSGSLAEHWRHDLLDSVAVSVFCDQPATDSHVHFLCAALGGSSQDDQICFLSAEAVCKIRGSILKSLASVLITSTFEWTKSSHFLLLPMEHEHFKILGEQSLSANFEMAQFAFQVLERSLFALRTHEEDSVFSHILAALFIIKWECSMALTLAEESDLKGHKEETNVEALMCNTSDDHLDETVHLKANLAEHIHAFRQSSIPSFWNDLHSGTLNRLANILAQSIRYAVFDTTDLPIERTAVLCSEWVVDMLTLICLDHIKLQSFFDMLLSEGEYWPLWVKPSVQNGHATVKIQREPLITDGTELKHERFIAFVDKLVLNLSFGEVISAPVSSFSRAWVAAEMICTWKWNGGSAFSTFLPSLVQYMKTEPCHEVSFVSLLLDTLLEGALMHASSDWALFNSWHLSDSEIEKIQDRYLRALVALLFTAYSKESVLRESDAHVLFQQLASSLFIGSTVNRKCLRTLPFVMSTIIKPLTENMRSNEASSCTVLLGKSILSWLDEAISCLSSSPKKVAQQDIEDWMQVVLSCFPLKITGGTPKLVVKSEREISDAETSQLLILFSRYQTFYASADSSLSSRETMLSKTVELLGVKLTAVMVGYCWTKLGENDWCFVFRILRKWIESSVLLVEEMADSINDAVVNQTSSEDTLEKLKLIACTMEDLTFTFVESALVTLCCLNLVDNLHETDNSQNLQLVKSGEYAESNDKMMENILRLFLASGVSEAIAGSCSEEASSIIASGRVDYLHFWELAASFIINASPQIRRSALESMKLWGLTKESVSGLYSILFSSEPIPHLQFAAYSLLMSEPLCQLSLVKGCSLGENPLPSQESDMGQSTESMPDSENALCLRDELSALIEMPTSELAKTDLIAQERVNVFVAWALVLSHLQLLPLSSTTRETILKYVQDNISPCILDCIFQHIPLRTAAPEAKAAAEASKNASVTCSLLPYVESLWPVGVLQMATLAGSLYGMMNRLLPSYVCTWFTTSWCSPPFLLDEFSQVKDSVYDSDETFSVQKEETGIDLVIEAGPSPVLTEGDGSSSAMEAGLQKDDCSILTESDIENLTNLLGIRVSTRWTPGSIRVYENIILAGLIRFPLDNFFCRILNHLKIPPGRLMKNGWYTLKCFVEKCEKLNIEPSVEVYLNFYRFKHQDIFYTVQKLSDGIVQGNETANENKGRKRPTDWRQRFVFLRPKSDDPWPFPTEWGEDNHTKGFQKPQLTDAEEVAFALLSDKTKPSKIQCELISTYKKEVEELTIAEETFAVLSDKTEPSKIQCEVILDYKKEAEELRKKCRLMFDELIASSSLVALRDQEVKELKIELQSARDLKQKYIAETQERKRLYNIVQELRGNIRVFCRCRPPNDAECVVDFVGADDGDIKVLNGSTERAFKLDRVFTPDHNQGHVYAVVSPMIISVLDGYNVCIFAYGQTGSGKTFTMEGTESNRGVNYRTLEDLFRIAQLKDSFTYRMTVSVIEIYNDDIIDLLADPPVHKLQIKQTSEGSSGIPGLTEIEIEKVEMAWSVLQTGSSRRASGSNNVNEYSSRSHSIVCITVKAKNLINEECTKSKLWLIDLAGSESVAKTQAEGDRLKEAQNINKSLSELSNVMLALASRSSHIPYRNCKLTHVLQESLGGDSKAVMLVMIDPSKRNVSETLESLKFATRVSCIRLGLAKRQTDSHSFFSPRAPSTKRPGAGYKGADSPHPGNRPRNMVCLAPTRTISKFTRTPKYKAAAK